MKKEVKMKVAIFYNLNFGGAKRTVFEQVKGLKKLGHSVDIYTTDNLNDQFNLKKISDNVIFYKYGHQDLKKGFIKRLLYDLNTYSTLRKVHKEIARDIDNGDYDAVIVHPDKLTQAPYLLRFLKTKSVYFCQEPLRIGSEYSLRLNKSVGVHKRIYESINREIRKKADIKNVRAATFTIASCLHVRERMIVAYDVYPEIIYLGVDETVFKRVLIKKKMQVLYFGNKNFAPDGYDLAISAVNLIPQENRPKLKIVSWVGNNNKRFSDSQLTTLYNESMITLCLSRYENFGLVPLESMACGTSVIATNIGGHRETVENNKTGFLTEPDPQGISNKITFLIENESFRKIMSKNARMSIEKKWTWKKHCIDLSNFLKEISA